MMEWLARPWVWGSVLGAGLVGLLVWRWREIHQRVGIWGYVGSVLGWLLILLATLGGLVPLMPGFPLAILGVLLLGPEDPILKRLWIGAHRLAVRLSTSRRPRLVSLGRQLLRVEGQLARRLFRGHPWPVWLEVPPQEPPVSGGGALGEEGAG